jgi:hypothetical protein
LYGKGKHGAKSLGGDFGKKWERRLSDVLVICFFSSQKVGMRIFAVVNPIKA